MNGSMRIILHHGFKSMVTKPKTCLSRFGTSRTCGSCTQNGYLYSERVLTTGDHNQNDLRGDLKPSSAPRIGFPGVIMVYFKSDKLRILSTKKRRGRTTDRLPHPLGVTSNVGCQNYQKSRGNSERYSQLNVRY
jgi:hypothetical protein